MKKTTVQFVRERVHDLEGTYSALSQIYYLPNLKKCNAITRDYLNDIMFKDSVWVPSITIPRYKYSFKGKGKEVLLEELNKLVKTKLSKDTSLTNLNTPDIKWLKNVLMFLNDGKDKWGFLGSVPKNYRLTTEERLMNSNQLELSIKPEYTFELNIITLNIGYLNF